jgi:hypothetical protein
MSMCVRVMHKVINQICMLCATVTQNHNTLQYSKYNLFGQIPPQNVILKSLAPLICPMFASMDMFSHHSYVFNILNRHINNKQLKASPKTMTKQFLKHMFAMFAALFKKAIYCQMDDYGMASYGHI